ncbi:argininosuccinate synthase [Candidatus Bathyarchaeota archaeon]|nr:argininosuccinate synthase [Candidatus Bathyarchaeota archaeon]
MKKIVLGYSGGLDTSVALKWLQEKYNAEVITVTVDVGQEKDFSRVEEKAKKIGACKHYHIDAKESFVKDYVFPAIKANALYEGKYPLSTALSRPLIAFKLVEIAEKEGADAIAHGCTGKGNDQVRFEVTIKALAPNLKIIAPIRDWGISRMDEIKYAKEKGIPIPVDVEKPYSIDENLWGRSIECGALEDPYVEPPENAFEWTKSPENALNTPEAVLIEFENGVPIKLNEEKLNSIELIEKLNFICGRHGVGRIDHIEDRVVGIKSREVYECPAALALIEAHKDLEKLTLTRHELSFKSLVDSQWSFLVYAGLWIDPLREALDAFINETQKKVSGVVKLKLYKGSVQVTGRKSPLSIYNMNLATYSVESAFNQKWSEGFIEIWGLPSKIAALRKTWVDDE